MGERDFARRKWQCGIGGDDGDKDGGVEGADFAVVVLEKRATDVESAAK